MKGEIYNFVLFSSIGDGTVANKSFFVDWSILPESRYKLTFSFASSTLANSTTYEAMLFINSANIMYNNKYEYDCSKFTTFFDDMCVTCPDHGEYTLTPFQHLNGLHCYYCDDHKYV